MIDDRNRPDLAQPDTASSDVSATQREDLQQVQDEAGIAGEPQPLDVVSADSETETDTSSEAEGHPS